MLRPSATRRSPGFTPSTISTKPCWRTPVTMGRWAIRAAVNILEKREVPKLLYTPILSVTKDDVATVDLSTVRAPAGWKPK